jgi:LuxR family maltose regulon positive regulatory protein
MEATQAVERLADRRTIPVTEVSAASAWKVRLWLAEGQLEAAARWAAEHRYDPDEEPSHAHEVEYLALARVLTAQGRTDESIQLLEWARKPAESDNRLAAQIEMLSLEALAHYSAGDVDNAIERLNGALALAEPAGFFRIFLDEGPAMASLLYEASTRGGSSAYIRRLLADFPVTEMASTKDDVHDASHPVLVERLSDRELEVLRLAAEGISNEQIGEKLFISMHTVKVHARNIYAKLDAHNRTEAVARARYFGILTDSPSNSV